MIIDVPSHEWCEGCKFFEIRESVLYSGVEGREVIYTCEHSKICKNAVSQYRKLLNSKESAQNDI